MHFGLRRKALTFMRKCSNHIKFSQKVNRFESFCRLLKIYFPTSFFFCSTLHELCLLDSVAFFLKMFLFDLQTVMVSFQTTELRHTDFRRLNGNDFFLFSCTYRFYLNGVSFCTCKKSLELLLLHFDYL